MSKIDNNKKQKRDSLLNASFDFFLTKGIEKTSISDIIEKAGVAKGTFYLYFKDKYDIKNRLVVHKSAQLFKNAYDALKRNETDSMVIEDKIIFVVDHILDELNGNKALLTFLHKDMSLGVFERAMDPSSPLADEFDIASVYRKLLTESGVTFTQPDIMLFMIFELAGSCGYSAIVDSYPCSLEELKPHLYRSIRSIIAEHTI